MKCPQCELAGTASRVVEHKKRVGTPSREVSFFDEAGEFHRHDALCMVTPFECSLGHTWEHRSAVRCPTCGIVVDPLGEDQFGVSA